MMFAPILLAALLGAMPASAIVYGELDGDGHPNVGALLNGTVYPDGTWASCSGVLIAPTVFLTAAHCFESDETTATVSFASVYEDEVSETYTGEVVLHPDFRGSNANRKLQYDLAVVLLGGDGPGLQPASLPALGSLSSLKGGKKTGQEFTSVGYGAFEVNNQPGGKDFVYADARRVGVGKLNAATKTFLHISQNYAVGNGGTCYGDSGGPNFLGDTDIIAMVTNLGDSVCRATNDSERLDTDWALDFLEPFIGGEDV